MSAHPEVPEAAESVFGDRIVGARRFVAFLGEHGVERGVIGPREVVRLWDRHILNSAVLTELIPSAAMVIDVGSGGGFPGVPIALARPDVGISLVEPTARRIAWLQEIVEHLELDNVTIIRGRAEEVDIKPADIVTARAVAPLAKLARWCLPLVKPNGHLLALKGASATDEVQRDKYGVRKAGGRDVEVVQCGAGLLETPTTVVSVRRRG